MRLSTGFVLLYVAIAFVQSKPLLNGAVDFNSIINQFASQNNVANQFVPSGVQAIIAQYAQLAALANQTANAVSQVPVPVSSAEIQAFFALVSQVNQQVASGQLSAADANKQLAAAFQQTFNAGKPIAPGFGTRAAPSAAPVSSAEIQAYFALVDQISQQVASGQLSAADANKQLAAAFQQVFG
ncbi:unnamed protein product [Adineta ricciae]|uniref:Uncharacterized protein n=1 Tax=Adineta ricciae TaxID=249248 RepID=A0A815RF29_ADIRI|nr:unnamed protein product [Adineta ricciae]CAF1526084.1 unnamed protein product [Adineta ricciae]